MNYTRNNLEKLYNQEFIKNDYHKKHLPKIYKVLEKFGRKNGEFDVHEALDICLQSYYDSSNELDKILEDNISWLKRD